MRQQAELDHSGTYLFARDAAYLTVNYGPPSLPANFMHNLEQYYSSHEKLRRLEKETGGKVILSHDMEQWRAMKHAPELREAYPKTSVCVPLDITNEEQIGAAVKASCDRFGTIDVLVNNAGYGYRAAIEESEKAEVQRLFDVNVFGPLVLIQRVLPVMRKNRQGTI